MNYIIYLNSNRRGIKMMNQREITERLEKQLVMVVENYDLNDVMVNKFCQSIMDQFECRMDLPFDEVPMPNLSRISVNKGQRESLEVFLVELLDEIYDAVEDDNIPMGIWLDWIYLNQVLTIDLGSTKYAIDMMSKYNELFDMSKF